MNSKERYLAAVNHQPHDRPPVDLMGTACGLTDGCYDNLKTYLGITGGDRQFRAGENVKYYNEEVLRRLHVDCRRVWLRQPKKVMDDANANKSFVDEWGIPQSVVGIHVQQTGWPLQDTEIEDLETYAHWPDMLDPARTEGLREEARKLAAAGEFAVIGRSPTAGFFERGCWFRNMEDYMVDTLTDPDYVYALNEKLTDLHIQLYGRYLDACGEYLDVIETADDYGTNIGPIISPKVFREQIKPWRRKLNDFIKSKAPHIKIFHHCCGDVFELIPDLIEVGIDILNPTQQNPGMMPADLNREYGRDICFHGAVDTIKALPSTREATLADLRNLREKFAGAGWIAAPANHFQDDVPAENIVAMYEYLTGKSVQRPGAGRTTAAQQHTTSSSETEMRV